MERKTIVVCSVVGLLGALAAATGFAAEATRIKGSEVHFTSTNHCVYPRTPALGLGVTSAVSLMLAHIIINVASGCVCCRRNALTSNSNRRAAVICFIVSWFTFVMAFLLLLTGAALNDQHDTESMYFGSYYCYVVKPGVFVGGSILGLASITLGIMYYLALNPAKTGNFTWGNSPAPGVAMGQPQFPPQTAQGPVFVHEDTYIRRQLA